MYPEAANYLPPPQLWCALFFFMSIFLGIDSQVTFRKGFERLIFHVFIKLFCWCV